MTKLLTPRYKKNKSHLVRGFFSSNTTSEENTKWKETAPGVVFLLSPCFGTQFFLLIWRLLLVYQAEVEGNCLSLRDTFLTWTYYMTMTYSSNVKKTKTMQMHIQMSRADTQLTRGVFCLIFFLNFINFIFFKSPDRPKHGRQGEKGRHGHSHSGKGE